MNHIEFADIYEKLVLENKTPILITNDEVYNMSPEAIRDLKINKIGISFSVTINHIKHHISMLMEDIFTLISSEKFNEVYEKVRKK